MPKRRETNEEMIIRYKSGDESALEDLLKANRGIICKMARKFGSNHSHDEDDCMQEGALALIDAVRLWDPTRGTKFCTYLYRAVWGRIWHYRATERIICLGSACNLETRERLAVGSLDMEKAGDMIAGKDRRPLDIVADEEETRDRRAQLREAMARLNDRERFVLNQRSEGVSLIDLGLRLGVCKERIRQIERAAIGKITKLEKAPASICAANGRRVASI